MINHELEDIRESTDSEGNLITEYLDRGYTTLQSPKRSEKFRLTKTSQRYGFFKILYESGKSIPNLEGEFTSYSDALKALKRYLASSKQTQHARYKDRWADKPVPELKTKDPRGRKAKVKIT